MYLYILPICVSDEWVVGREGADCSVFTVVGKLDPEPSRLLLWALMQMPDEIEAAGAEVEACRSGWLSRVPDLAGVVLGSFVSPRLVEQAGQVVLGPPAEQESGLAVVEPG